MTLEIVALVVGTYLVGAIPASYLVAKYGAGIDLRQKGSGNLGATNLYRAGGWKFAVPVAVFDVAKGFVPVAFGAPLVGDEPWIPLLVGVAAVLGHVYPVYLKFKGGKGVATAGGVLFGLAPIATLISVVVWVLFVATTGFASLASMTSAVSFPLAVWALAPSEKPLIVSGVVVAMFIVFTHRSNIRRLIQGTEARFGHRAKEA